MLAALGGPDNFAVFAAGLLVVGGFVIVAYLTTARDVQDFGMTTELALVATFALGALAVLGAPFEATAAAIVMALVLDLKTEMHNVILGLERKELMATLQLLLIAAVLVPLLPARPMGPWDAVNPRTIGMLVLLIAALSYIGYFAVRVLGSRLGLMLTALFGGLSSSTAVTVAYARRSLSVTSHRSLCYLSYSSRGRQSNEASVTQASMRWRRSPVSSMLMPSRSRWPKRQATI